MIFSRRLLFLLLVVVLSGPSANAVTMFLDLNDAPKEIDACCKGMKKAGVSEELRENNCAMLTARPKSREKGSGRKALLAKMLDMCDAGIRVDHIVISGESTSDNVWGEFGNFSSDDLKRLRRDFVEKSKERDGIGCMWRVESLSMPACYAGTRYNSQKFWVNEDTNVQVSMAYAAQSPSKERPQLHDQLQWNCGNHKELVQKSVDNELCEFVKNIPAFGESNMSVCDVNGVYSQLYKTASADPLCHSNEELAARCDQLLQDDKKTGAWRDVFEKYYHAEEDDFADPKTEEYWVDKTKELSPVRQAYNDAQLARDCYESESPGEAGNALDVPSNAVFLRLAKYGHLKENIGAGSAAAIASFNNRVPERMRVNLPNDSRRTLKRKIENAIEYFSELGDKRKLRMAICMKETFIDLNATCSVFATLKPDHKDIGSDCLKTYANSRSTYYNPRTERTRNWRVSDGCKPYN